MKLIRQKQAKSDPNQLHRTHRRSSLPSEKQTRSSSKKGSKSDRKNQRSRSTSSRSFHSSFSSKLPQSSNLWNTANFQTELSSSLRCVVIGDEQVGKSSLIYRYANNDFQPQYEPTIFDICSVKKLKVGKKLEMDIWDIGGCEEAQYLRKMSFENSDVFLVCFSISNRTSFESIKTLWVDELKRYAPNSPFILVGTKSDIIQKIPTKDKLRCLTSQTIPAASDQPVPAASDQPVPAASDQPVPAASDQVECKNADNIHIDRFVSTTEGHLLAKQIGAQSYVECSSENGRNVGRVFHEAFHCVLKKYFGSRSRARHDRSGDKSKSFTSSSSSSSCRSSRHAVCEIS